MTETNPVQDSYLTNLISLLSLRLFSCLGLCDPENRTEAHEQITDAVENPLADLYVHDTDEAIQFLDRVQELSAEQETLFARAEKAGLALPIEQLRDKFDLNGNEMLLLTAILAPVLDERFRRIYRLFQHGIEEPRMDFLLGLIEEDGLKRYANAHILGLNGTLLSRCLIESSANNANPGTAATFRPAPGLLSWLSGTRSLSPYYGHAAWITPRQDGSAAEAPVIETIASAVQMSEISNESIPVISIYGPDRAMLLDTVESLAAEMERPLLKLNLENLDPVQAEPMIRLAMRDCILNHGLPALYGLDSWIDSGGILPTDFGEMLSGWNCPMVLISKRQCVFPITQDGLSRLILRIPVDGLAGSQRTKVWQQSLKGLPLDESLTEEAISTLAGQFVLNTAQIHAAVNAGLGIAVTEDRDLRIGDLYEGARVSSMHHLGDLAKKIPARYTLADLVLPEKQKLEIEGLISMARNRSKVLEDWGIGKKLVSGSGLSALFTGTPGTGKTLAAQAIAGELGLDLYRVDLSTIVSKYIGETEKNLEHIFTEAQNSNVILFFDEADSLFGKRSDVGDAQDRYANIEVGYLLQRIETYDGIVLMATNLGANLDEAFARRINFIIDFPFPDEETRLRLWQLLLPSDIEKEPDIDLAPFAASFKIAGGNIRNAIVWAIYASAQNGRPLSREDLLKGVEREYQKMGKVFLHY